MNVAANATHFEISGCQLTNRASPMPSGVGKEFLRIPQYSNLLPEITVE
jgi:hypothetical protein